MQRNSEKLLKKNDVVQRGNVSLRTVDYWIEKNQIPYLKFGGAVRFIPSDVDAFIASRRIGAIKKNHRKSKAPLRQAAL
jgi:excisionase family DNA binding protein